MYLIFFNKLQNEKGMVAVITLLGVSAIAMAVIVTLTLISAGEMKMVQSGGTLDQTYYAAESGMNEALYRLITYPVPGNYSFAMENIIININVAANPGDPYQRIITSQAADPNGKIRTVRVIANTDSYAGGFDSAVNSGAGGVIMENGSCVIGNIYSNGAVEGPGSGDNGCKTSAPTACRPAYDFKHSVIQKNAIHNGKVTLTGANSVTGVSNGGDIIANNIKNSIAGNYAKYQSLTGSVKASGGGETCSGVSGTYCIAGYPNEPAKNLPVTAAVINNWKSEITDTAPTAYDDCPADSTKYCIDSDNRVLGAQKIEGDFYIGNGQTLTLAGNLWVTGNIILDNNGTIRLDPGFKALSAVIIADGIIDVSNNYVLSGSGDPKSFLLMISSLGPRTGDCSDHDLSKRPAICAANNSNSIIFAAPDGDLFVKNNGCLNASATYKIHLMQNSTVNFNPDISSFTVPAGGGTDVGTALGTWQEL